MLRLRVAVLASTLVAVSASMMSAVPAQAADGGSLSIAPNGVIYPGCQSIPYQLNLPSDVGSSWSVDVTLRGPDGLEVASDFVYSGSPTPDGLQVCAYQAEPGTYSVTGEGEYFDSSMSREYKFSLAPTSTNLRDPRTRATIKTSAKRVKKGRTLKVSTQVTDERPAGFFKTEYAKVRIEERIKGRWYYVRGTTKMTNSSGRATLSYVGRGKKTELRVAVLDTDLYAYSASKVIKIKKG